MVSIHGLKEAVAGSAQTDEKAVDYVGKLLRETASKAAEKARAYAPVRTGRLRESITSRRVGKTAYLVEAAAPCAGYVEFGTTRFPPRGFMRRALSEALRELLQTA
ncbi:MAG: HK97 gp10 family phage protein [Candidatus Caldarchaeum sp.]